jgi:hypothetical protein
MPTKTTVKKLKIRRVVRKPGKVLQVLKLLEVPRPGKDYTLNLPKPHLSYSQVDLYRRCPEKYYRRYILGIKEPTTWALAEGSVMAKVLEGSNLHKVAHGKHVSLNRVKLLHHATATALCKDIQGDESSLTEVISRGEKFLTKFWGLDGPDLEPCMVNGKPGVELEIQEEFGGVPFVLIPDVIEEGCVVDGKVAKTTRYYNAEHDLQLSLYAVAAKRKKVGYLVFCKQSGKIEELWGTRNLKRTRTWCDMLVGRVAFGISMGVFPPTDPAKDFLCNPKWCAHWDTCYGTCV